MLILELDDDGGPDLDTLERPPSRPAPPKQAAEIAAEDLRIPRPDLGPGAYTLIIADDEIPPALVRLMRQARREAPREAPRKPRRARRRDG